MIHKLLTLAGQLGLLATLAFMLLVCAFYVLMTAASFRAREATPVFPRLFVMFTFAASALLVGAQAGGLIGRMRWPFSN